MKTIPTNIRIEKQLREDSVKILDDLGLSLSSAITLFLKQVTLNGGLPFRVEYPQKTPSASLLQAINEANELTTDANAKTYNNHQEVLDELGISL